MDKLLYRALLLDFYGSLLTEKQFESYEEHYLNDLSLNEIAEEQNTSRQAVWDLVDRTEKILVNFEEKLGLIKSHQEMTAELDRAIELLSEAKKTNEQSIAEAVGILRRLKEM